MQALALRAAVTLFGFEGAAIESQPFFLEEKSVKFFLLTFSFKKK